MENLFNDDLFDKGMFDAFDKKLFDTTIGKESELTALEELYDKIGIDMLKMYRRKVIRDLASEIKDTWDKEEYNDEEINKYIKLTQLLINLNKIIDV